MYSLHRLGTGGGLSGMLVTLRTLYRSEREYGRFYCAVPLPEGVKLEDVKATFADGVPEVSVPLPAKPEANVRQVRIEEPKAAAKSAA